MIRPIYTSVSNARITPCDKKGQIIKSDPIPLLRNNYLGEYRTELEKAKVRKNLGIADGSVIEWGNISGYIEDNADLKEALAYTLPEHLKDVIKEDFSTVKGALGWAIEYLSTFVMDTESIAWLKQEAANIRQIIQEQESEIYEQIEVLSKDIYNNSENIVNIKNSIQEINTQIEKINENLLNIDVDANILAWIKNANSNSIQLTDDSKLEVKISNYENNAITVDESGLYVPNLSNEVNTASQNIEQLQTNVQEIINTYVTKEDLGGGDFNFVKQDSFDQHVEQANITFDKINQELLRTVKTGEDGHVDTLYVNQISKDNEDGNIKITDSFEVTTGVPLDIRTVVKHSDDLYKISPNVAYPGMTVANIDNGNIYMLIDKSKISEKSGWKASYESIQIITCTQEQYDEWSDNTTEDFKPIDESKSYLHEETYYYIYEDDHGQYYLSSAWGADIEKRVNSKASSESVSALYEKVEVDIKNLTNNYTNTETLIANYVNVSELDLGNPDSYISRLISNYYTSKQTDEKFVTKESLRGGNTEGDDDFIFVTQNQYSKDQEEIRDELDKTLKLDGEGSLSSISVGQIKSQDGNLTVAVKETGLYIGEDPIATESIVPKIVTLTEEEYNNLVEEDNIKDDVYYYIYNSEDPDLIYVTAKRLKDYSTTIQYQSWVNSNFYTIQQIDDIVTSLQVGTNDQLSGYYTNAQTDAKFLSKNEAIDTYATKLDLQNLESEIEETYVTIAMLKGNESDDDDFMFVTQKQYSQDKDTLAQEISTKKINIQESEDNTIQLTTQDNRLCVSNEKIAFISEVPKIELMTQTDYDQKVELGEIKDDVYYYTYDEEGNPKNIYITLDYLQKYYVSKYEVSSLIQGLEDRIKALETATTNN